MKNGALCEWIVVEPVTSFTCHMPYILSHRFCFDIEIHNKVDKTTLGDTDADDYKMRTIASI